jgi:hypothetical protein
MGTSPRSPGGETVSKIEYQCGCTAGGDNIASFCPNHNVPINTVSDKQGKCYKVLQCLYIALDGSVAHDVNYTVKAYLMELESRVRELEAELITCNKVKKLWKEETYLRISERDKLQTENNLLIAILFESTELTELRARNAELVDEAKEEVRWRNDTSYNKLKAALKKTGHE